MADDYKSKLEAFFGVVPKSASPTTVGSSFEYYGEVPSGTPIVPIPNPAALPAAKAVIAKGPIVNNPTFVQLTGMTHAQLLKNWETGGILTSCNSFVGNAGSVAGVSGLGGFYVEDQMTQMGKHHCWFTPQSGEKPQFGDIFETRSQTPGKKYLNLHVGISLSFDGDDWYTIEGGQGGPSIGFDRVARVKKKYQTSDLLGWVDIRLLASGQAAVPGWLIGTWMIYADKNYIYSFNRYGEVTQKAYQPPSGQKTNVPDLDTGKMVWVTFDMVKVKWDRDGGTEVFTHDWEKSFSGIIERMNGVAADGSTMWGVRL